MRHLALIFIILLSSSCDAGSGFDLVSYGHGSTWESDRTPSPSLTASTEPATGCCGCAISLKDFGAIGNGIADDTIAWQTAVTTAQNTTGALCVPNGDYKISAPITFLSKSLRITGAGATSTAVSQFSGAPITLFDMSNIGGPSVLVENISFNGPATGGYGGTGVYVSASNGIILRNVWFRGLTKGVHKTNTASYVSQTHTVFEFCVTANHYDDGVQCTIAEPLYYRNLTDLYLTGDAYSFIHSNSQHGETRYTCIHLQGARGAQISGVTCRQDFDSALPDIIRFSGGSCFNIVDRITTNSFGRVVVTMVYGSMCRNNRISNIMASNEVTVPPTWAPPANTLAAVIEIGATNTGNSFSGIHAANCSQWRVDVAGGNTYRDVSTSSGATTTWVY